MPNHNVNAMKIQISIFQENNEKLYYKLKTAVGFSQITQQIMSMERFIFYGKNVTKQKKDCSKPSNIN